jgi:chemotaxis protein CheC
MYLLCFRKGHDMADIEVGHIPLDVMRELSSMAAGNAATSLSVMVGKKVDITLPSISVEALEKLPEVLGGKDKFVAVIHFLVSGQVSGSIFLLLSPSESLSLIRILTGQNVIQSESLDEPALSALKELGNVITGSYTTVLAQELKMRVEYSVPGFSYDMLGAILDATLSRLSSEAELAIITKSEFIVGDDICRAHLIFILTAKAVNNIIRALANWEDYGQKMVRSGHVRHD